MTNTTRRIPALACWLLHCRYRSVVVGILRHRVWCEQCGCLR